MKTICVGISFYPKDGEDLDTIIKKSDIAIETREAKNKGKGIALRYLVKMEHPKVELF